MKISQIIDTKEAVNEPLEKAGTEINQELRPTLPEQLELNWLKARKPILLESVEQKRLESEESILLERIKTIPLEPAKSILPESVEPMFPPRWIAEELEYVD